MRPATDQGATWSAPVWRCRPLLGTFVEVAAEQAEHAEAAFAAIHAVHDLMSVHSPDSDLSHLNAYGCGQAVELHPWTAAVLERALFWAEASEGDFDPTLGGWMQRVGLIPRRPDQPAPDPRASWRDVWLVGLQAGLRRDCVLDLGGIAKGFAVDMAVAAMVEAGAERGLVNAGGDLRGVGEMEWTVAVADPRTRRPAGALRLRGAAAATSAVHPGRRGGRHLPLRAHRYSSATVVAPDAMDADALTKVVLAGGRCVESCLRLAGACAVRATFNGSWQELA